jgi:hypothetical protein
MLKIDAATLAQLIDTCFELSMDGRLADDRQRDFLVAGKRLRGSLVNLISAQFDDATQGVLTANAKLEEANKRAAKLTDDLSAASNVLTQVNSLVGALDDLLKLASSFH